MLWLDTLNRVTSEDRVVHEPSSQVRSQGRRWWIAIQLITVVPFLWSAALAIEMTFAIPGKGYYDASGTYVTCEALAARGKPYTAPRCAAFGSMETNPVGYAGAIALVAALSSALWFTTRPGRGLRFSRARK